MIITETNAIPRIVLIIVVVFSLAKEGIRTNTVTGIAAT